MVTNRRRGCGQPVNRCSFLQFCGIVLREMMNNVKSKGKMMIASLRDEVNKHKCVSSLFFSHLCSYILSPTVLEAITKPTYALLYWKHPRSVCMCMFVCMHAT